jgi:hypothetical protein
MNRLFAVAVCGAQAGEPSRAIPISAVSALWWAGAEQLDDLADRATPSDMIRAQLAQIPIAVTNLVLAPLAYIRSLDHPDDLLTSWSNELVESCIRAAEGGSSVFCGSYITKTHHALLPLRRIWQTAHRRFGCCTPRHVTPSARNDWLQSLRADARTNLSRRAELLDYLRSPAVLASYEGDICELHRAACRRLDQIARPGRYRNALRAAIDFSAGQARPSIRSGILRPLLA